MARADGTLALMSANGSAPAHDQSRGPGLPADTLPMLATSLHEQCRRYRKQLRKCQRKFTGTSVHDLRVAARRLLSLLDLLAAFLPAGRLKKLRCELKCHLDTFDDLRDIQVQIPAVCKFRKEFAAARCFHHFLKKREARLSRSTRKRARRLRSKPLGKLLHAAGHDLKRRIQNASPAETSPLLIDAVDQAFFLAKTRKDNIAPADTRSIHCTRVAFKKFRYVLEALKDCWRGGGAELSAKMHRYQTFMGDIQDAEVLLRGFQEFARKKRLGAGLGLKFERALYDRRQRRIRKYLARADQLLDFWPLPGKMSRRGRPVAGRSARLSRRPRPQNNL